MVRTERHPNDRFPAVFLSIYSFGLALPWFLYRFARSEHLLRRTQREARAQWQRLPVVPLQQVTESEVRVRGRVEVLRSTAPTPMWVGETPPTIELPLGAFERRSLRNEVWFTQRGTGQFLVRDETSLASVAGTPTLVAADGAPLHPRRRSEVWVRDGDLVELVGRPERAPERSNVDRPDHYREAPQDFIFHGAKLSVVRTADEGSTTDGRAKR